MNVSNEDNKLLNTSNNIYLKYPDNTIKNININNVLFELYFNLAVISSEKYSTKNINEIKKEISKLESDIPLFDIYSKNFYLITAQNIYSRVIFNFYRLPDNKIVKRLKKTLNNIKDSKSNINKFYLEKLEKNINFIENFDLDTLKITYFKLFYMSNPITSDLTSCIRPSFISFLTAKPYYTKSELINLALNMNLKIDVKSIESDEICAQVSDNDINSRTILEHHLYIEENIAKAYVQLYTLLGSFYWNYYLRNKCYRDLILEKQINNLYLIISKAPAFDKDYYLYRFIDDDSYLTHLKINEIYEEKSFISTTRNPFYDPKNNLFGFTLIKIKIPKKIEGVALCIETYSLFPNEEEILLNPSKLKLVAINNNFHYYHPNAIASSRIKKVYVFEFIESINHSPINNTVDYELTTTMIPKINFLELVLDGDDFVSRIYYFYRIILPSFNNKRYFYADIAKKEYLFQAFYLDDNPVYEKYFYLQKSNKNDKNEIYFILQDENTGQIILFIELRDIISVNYIHRFIGSKDVFTDQEIIEFISSIGYFFGINDIILHNSFESYNTISKKLLKDYNENILDQDNPDNYVESLYSGDLKFYNKDLINFMKKDFSRFKNIPAISYNLKKHHIIELEKIKAEQLFKDIVKTPLYNILLKYNKNNKTSLNLIEFYLYIHEKYFFLLPEFNELIAFYNNDIFANPESNPWLNSFYIINSQEYLYETKLISFIKTFQTDIYYDYIQKLTLENKEISLNKYRLGLISIS
jgi:hypothetical protein